jgi:hypothetical protein
MPQELVQVRMLNTIDQCPIVLELLMGHVYTLPRANADALRDAGALEFVTDHSARLEAAAQAAPRRRG